MKAIEVGKYTLCPKNLCQNLQLSVTMMCLIEITYPSNHLILLHF